MKVNIGGGKCAIPGYIKLDLDPEWAGVKTDIIHDLEDGLPFEDRSVDVINAAHIFEHIRNFIPLMNECWRVLKDDGFMMAAVPVFPSDAAVGPPDHIRYFVAKTFMCFTRAWCPPGRKPWIKEMGIEMVGPFLGEGTKEPQLFVLMRPDREGGEL